MERMSTTTNNTMAHYFKPLKGQYISFKYMITETSLFDNPGFYDHQSPWYRFDKKYGLMLFLLVISAVIAWWVFLWILIGYAVFFIHTFKDIQCKRERKTWSHYSLEEQKACLFEKRPELYRYYQNPCVEAMVIQWDSPDELEQLYHCRHAIDNPHIVEEIDLML